MISREGGHLSLGLVVGIFVATIFLLALDSFDLPFAITDGVLGAIVGGFIAGGVAIAGQFLVLIAESEVLEKAERRSQRVAAQGIFLKGHTIYDYTRKAHNYYRTFDRASVLSMAPAEESQFGVGEANLWKPLKSRKTVIKFDADEKKFALDLKNVKFFNSLVDLEASFEQLQFIELEYSEKFDQFERRNVRGQLRGLVGRQVHSEGPVNPLDILELIDLLIHLRRLAVSTLNHAISVNSQIIEILAADHKMKITLGDNLSADGAMYNE